MSLIIGWRAKARSGKAVDNTRTGAIIALALGLISVVLSILHLIITTGAVFGSGSGKAGAIVALVLSLAGISLSGPALRKSNERIRD